MVLPFAYRHSGAIGIECHLAGDKLHHGVWIVSHEAHGTLLNAAQTTIRSSELAGERECSIGVAILMMESKELNASFER